MKRALVTGGSGFVGANLVRRLLREGHEVHLSSYNEPLGGATSFVSVLSLPFLLDGLVPQLARAMEGTK